MQILKNEKIIENNEKVIIFSHTRETAKTLSSYLSNNGIIIISK